MYYKSIRQENVICVNDPEKHLDIAMKKRLGSRHQRVVFFPLKHYQYNLSA